MRCLETGKFLQLALLVLQLNTETRKEVHNRDKTNHASNFLAVHKFPLLLSKVKPEEAWAVSHVWFFKGLPSRIGQLLAIIMATKIVAPNVWGWIADHTGWRMSIVRLASMFSMLVFVGVFWVEGFWPLACAHELHHI